MIVFICLNILSKYFIFNILYPSAQLRLPAKGAVVNKSG